MPTFDITRGLVTTRTGGRSRTSTAGGSRDRVAISIEAPQISVSIDADDFLKRVGRPLARTLRRRLLSGQGLSGGAAPSPAPATLERRERRRAQVARGGAPKDPSRYPDAKHQAQKRFYNGRVAGNVGGWHVPGRKVPTDAFGVESGLLARSIAFGKDRYTGKWSIFFANNRAIVGKDGESPAMRVFSRPGMDVSASSVLKDIKPEIRRASRAIVARQARRLVGALADTSSSLFRLQQAYDRETQRIAAAAL